MVHCRFTLLAWALLFSYLLSIHFYGVSCTQFEVGGDKGWVVPKSKDGDRFYYQWASKNRFKINDTVRFKYQKDSVMVVTEEEYKKCRASHPFFFSNNGDSIFALDRPGLFYFISGVSGHCQRGQRLIIKVLEPAAPPQSSDSTAKKSAAINIHGGISWGLLLVAAIVAPTVMLSLF